MPANLENSAESTGLEKVSFHSNPRKAMPKNVQTAGYVSVNSWCEKKKKTVNKVAKGELVGF